MSPGTLKKFISTCAGNWGSAPPGTLRGTIQVPRGARWEAMHSSPAPVAHCGKVSATPRLPSAVWHNSLAQVRSRETRTQLRRCQCPQGYAGHKPNFIQVPPPPFLPCVGSPVLFFFFLNKLSLFFWASLIAQWLRIHLPMQGTRVRALVREDPTCHGATKPVRHNY